MISVPEMQRLSRPVRSALLLGTALCASVGAHAQPAPNARPVGGVVVGGTATISQTPNNTVINQSTARGAINWQSFNIGSQQSVTFQQPGAGSVTMNTVTGPNPSQIAGRIDANGQIVVINQSGVVFYKGSQVNTAGLVVSAVGANTGQFMAGGKIVLDQAARPNARIVNNGKITIKGAGLAALVAPAVANAGVINATLGHVVLAGAPAATLDLYGDKLVSVVVTGAVGHAPDGADTLVTNTGVIRANGGTVQLTARAVDGVVSDLVNAGGKIDADTVGSHRGRITIDGIGGSITISGDLNAAGKAPGTTGGQIGLLASDTVIVKPTARVNASGTAGGGTIAIGTTLKRATGGPAVTGAKMARGVLIQQGATIAANATGGGNGGRIVALSSLATQMDGAISATGGPAGGNGGFVEVSGGKLSLTGPVDVSAPAGNVGEILLDPTNLTIVNGRALSGDQDYALFSNGGTLLATAADTPNDQVSNGELQSLAGNILLQATNNLTVSAPITLSRPGQSLTLQAGNVLTVQTGAPISTFGAITLTASGTLALNAAVSSNNFGAITLSAGTGGVTLNANVDAGNTNAVQIVSGGNIAQSGPASLSQPVRSEIDLTHVRGGVVTLTASGTISQSGYAAIEGDQSLTLTAGGGIFQNGPTTTGSPVTFPGSPGSPVVGSDIFGPNGVTIDASQSVSQTGDARISTLTGGTASLNVGGDLTQSGFGQIIADKIAISITGGLQQSGNAIIASVAGGTTRTTTISSGDIVQNGSASIAGSSAVTLNTSGSLSQSSGGSIASSNGDVTVGGSSLNLAGSVSGAAVGLTASGAITLSGLLSAPTITVNNGGGSTNVLDGATIQTSGVTRPTGSLTSGGLPTATSSEGGLYITTGQFTQSGRLTVSGSPSIVRIDASQVRFASSGGLIAPNSWLILGLGNQATATGNIDVAALDVSYASTGRGAALTGSVGGFTQASAATASNIEPATGASYQLNNCEIAVSVCSAPAVSTPYLFSAALTSVDAADATAATAAAATSGGVNYQLGIFIFGSIVYPSDESDLLLPLVSDLEY